MKIIVISDTHNALNFANKAIHQNTPDLIIFLGDVLLDCIDIKGSFPNTPIVSVAGNCDYYSNVKDEIIMDIEGKKFLICHGHTYNVKSGIDNLIKVARDKKVDICLFGHTHKPLNELKNNIYYLNPGTCKISYTNEATYGIIVIENNKITCRINKIED